MIESKNNQILNTKFKYFKILKIFEKEISNKKRKYAKCKCNCGQLFECRVDQLNNRKGCRKCGCKHGGKNRILPNFEAAKQVYYNSYRTNALKRNLAFNLSREQFDEIISKDCYYCGMKPQDQSYLSKSTKNHSKKFYASGIDRINNKLGYIKNNLVPCCSRCNRMKMDMNFESFIEHIFDILEHLRNKNYKAEPLEKFK